jgi:hypothetical protein
MTMKTNLIAVALIALLPATAFATPAALAMKPKTTVTQTATTQNAMVQTAKMDKNAAKKSVVAKKAATPIKAPLKTKAAPAKKV